MSEPSGNDGHSPTPDCVDRLSYFADILEELTSMARGARLDRLATILELAHDEAECQLEAVREIRAARQSR